MTAGDAASPWSLRLPTELRLLAAPALRRDNAVWMPLSSKDALLLAVLALEGARPREHLAVLLWPHSGAAGARANLRQRIRKLQELSQQTLLASEGAMLSLREDVLCDVHRLDSLLAADAAAARGTLLGELSFDDEDAARHWLRLARQRVAAARDAGLRAAADACMRRGEIDAALPWLQRIADEHP
ncbi:MAG: hypothetical protein RL227_1226, partial [Pseudomonadota bacterium]